VNFLIYIFHIVTTPITARAAEGEMGTTSNSPFCAAANRR
jgi:hypothetical protein